MTIPLFLDITPTSRKRAFALRPLPKHQPQLELDSEPHRDPNHSRPLDVHRWSDHPEVRALTDEIWESHFRDRFEANAGRPGKRPKTNPKRQLRVLLLDLYVAWCADPLLCIGVPMNRDAYEVGSRYNAIHISPIMIDLVNQAHAIGLIGFWRGSEGAGKVSRIWAEDALVERFKQARFGVLDIGHFPAEECIILSAGKRKWLEYEDTPDTIELRTKVTAYNRLLHHTFIDIPVLDRPIVELPSATEGKPPTLVRIDQNAKFVRRIFYRGDFALGGRFHGGFWQRLPEDWRKQIYINDRPVVEDDFKGFHVALLYGREGLPMPNDPYELDLVHEFAPDVMRDWVKALVLVAINASDESTAFQAFRGEQPTGSPAKHFANKTLKVMLDAFKAKHPAIAQHLCSDAGVSLMAVDGRIAARVVDHFTAKSIPVLAIHDSFVINFMHAEELRSVMYSAMQAELPGAFASVDRQGKGNDDYRAQAFPQSVDFKERRAFLGYVLETEGYRYRSKQFEEWLKSQSVG